jgi:hypothetical protein
MTSIIKFYAQQDRKRARSAGKRLGALVRKYMRDPEENFSVRSEAAALAVKASYYLRKAETAAGRVILTDHGERRQVFIHAASGADSE